MLRGSVSYRTPVPARPVSLSLFSHHADMPPTHLVDEDFLVGVMISITGIPSDRSAKGAQRRVLFSEVRHGVLRGRRQHRRRQNDNRVHSDREARRSS